VEKNKGGRPPKLQPDDDTLGKIRKIASLHATKEEAAAFLDVTKPTFNKFLSDHEKAERAWETGLGHGKLNLRRMQMKTAEAGNASMLIWLGKQLLDQKDKHEMAGDIKHLHEIAEINKLDLARRIAATLAAGQAALNTTETKD
jgi:hypothetical protein